MASPPATFAGVILVFLKGFGRRFGEKLIEGLLTVSGWVTSITVVLIIIFIFREGLGIFNDNPIDDAYVLAVHPKNPVEELTADEVKNIFDRKITRWDKVSSYNDTIITFSGINAITDFVSEEELGDDLENIPQKLNEVLNKHTGIIMYVPKQFLPGDFRGKPVTVPGITPGSFLSGKDWYPTAEPAAQYGVLPLILGTLWVSIGAILIALPLALATAIFMAEVANSRVREWLKPVVELLAGIPSVVYGFFGLVIIVPAIQEIFGLPVGETGLAGSIVLAIMSLPTIITIAEDAIRNVPRAMKEASLALGASHWQTIYRVVLPYASSGITAAIILGIGRAIGETMAVLMVTGNAGVIPTTLLEPLRTIPATIAAELGEAPHGGLHFKALFALGCILFLITFLINLIFEFVARRRRMKA